MSAMYIFASAFDSRLWVIGSDKHENPAQPGLALMAAQQSSSMSGSGQQCASVKKRYCPRALRAPAAHRSMSWELDEYSTQAPDRALIKWSSLKSTGTTRMISKEDFSMVCALQLCQHRSHWPR